MHTTIPPAALAVHRCIGRNVLLHLNFQRPLNPSYQQPGSLSQPRLSPVDIAVPAPSSLNCLACRPPLHPGRPQSRAVHALALDVTGVEPLHHALAAVALVGGGLAATCFGAD